MDVKIEPGWRKVLQEEFEKPYFSDLVHFVKSEYQQKTVYPPGNKIFRAFDLCPMEKVKVVIIGQDPYHGPGQANGLCFSVTENITMPPSLINIFKEMKSDLGKEFPQNGSLERWAEQGVLLLNATLTVRAREAGSHQNKGWEQFTDAVIRTLATRTSEVVYILWGAYAQRKGEVIPTDKNLVIKSPHPSPFSAGRGFFGSRPFSKANEYLISKGKPPVEW